MFGVLVVKLLEYVLMYLSLLSLSVTVEDGFNKPCPSFDPRTLQTSSVKASFDPRTLETTSVRL